MILGSASVNNVLKVTKKANSNLVKGICLITIVLQFCNI